jgi:uncharacterized membrane protein
VPPAANPTPGPKAVPVYGKVVLKGTTFGSRMEVVLQMERGGLYKGEVGRIIGDMMDQIVAGNLTTRWEHFEFERMFLKRGDDGEWVEVERDKPKASE